MAEWITLPDGSQAVVYHSVTWGEAVLILLLVAVVFLKVYELWIAQHKSNSSTPENDS